MKDAILCKTQSGLCEGLLTPHIARPKVSLSLSEMETWRSDTTARSGDRRRTTAVVRRCCHPLCRQRRVRGGRNARQTGTEPAKTAAEPAKPAAFPPARLGPVVRWQGVRQMEGVEFLAQRQDRSQRRRVEDRHGRADGGHHLERRTACRMNYEIESEAMRTDGHDFFCGLTFPVGRNPCTLICGGWGGSLIGLSSIDGFDASENTTTGTKNFEAKHWYKIKVRVTKERIEAWIDNDKIVTYPQDPDDKLEKHKIGIRFEVEPSVPLGIPRTTPVPPSATFAGATSTEREPTEVGTPNSVTSSSARRVGIH